MSTVTAAAVKSLRDRTDLPMMKCKKALVEAGGDEEKAIELLKEEMKLKVKSRSDNECNEGRVFVKSTEDGSKTAAVEFRCESEPVSKSEGFTELGEALVTQLLVGPGASSAEELMGQPNPSGSGTLQEFYDEVNGKIQEKFDVAQVVVFEGPVGVYVHTDGKSGAVLSGEGSDTEAMRDVAMHITAMKPAALTRDDVDPAKVQAERDRLTEEAKASGKPDNIVEKIVEGRMGNFYKEDAGVLVEQPFVKGEGETVGQFLKTKGVEPKRFVLFKIGA